MVCSRPRTSQPAGARSWTSACHSYGWIDALPPCARAIRTRAIGKGEDLADSLDIKFYIMKQRIPDAVELARKGLKRNLGQAYFYYAITLSADHTEGLRAAKKG
ncbi:hypothetical protein H0H87_001950 [Tephrocybe sp. NHM501043]|nr:hypothetical protein H0H87_001950 [Tephrocybe sp. NHM501043]